MGVNAKVFQISNLKLQTSNAGFGIRNLVFVI